ncbi:hypothetical protein MOO46_04180 [Apilactobacillus apisilvae]|uniref:Uncharacterized protein n=1 Tax=Apilactobacillus apisilvae TaxID=2923364 RepID=A0ABY4PFN8_9LACO|nr:hypothetical protein [Apilactobacillus apisilvae]UQS84460.1 hypothetical protein MOO46_04180 [Apilactobacillus apisilvae]
MKSTLFDSHEYQLNSQSDLPKTCNFVLTYASSGSVISIDPDGNAEYINPGTILGLNYEIRTDNNSRIEIRSSTGSIYRLGCNSSFSIQNTFEGEVPIYYGNVYINTLRSKRITDGGKYRTSCYMPSRPINALIVKVNDHEDCYYSLEDSIEVMEYDEKGLSFEICKVPSFNKLLLSFNDDLNMRERYNISLKKSLNNQEINYIYKEWVSPVNWK